MRHQIPHPEFSSSSFVATTGPSGSGASSSITVSIQGPFRPPPPPPPGSKSHSVIRTLRQKSMMGSTENRRFSFVSSAFASSSLVLANLEKAHQAKMTSQHGPFNAVKNIVKGMNAIIVELRAEADNNPTPPTGSPGSIADCNEVESLKQRLATVSRANHMMAIHLDLIELQKNMEVQEQRELEEKKSFVTAAREELYKEIVELLEVELSCSICNEIFITPTVTRCGHSFCEMCITMWLKDKIDCPICRAIIFKEFRKHHEIENFITRVHLRLSEDIQQNRIKLVTERMTAMEALRAANRPSPQPQPQQQQAAPQPPPSTPSAPERPAAYRNYRRLLRRPANQSAEGDEDVDEPEDQLRNRIMQQLETTTQDRTISGIRIRTVALPPGCLRPLRIIPTTISTDPRDSNAHNAQADVPFFVQQRSNNNNVIMEPPDARLIPRPRISARRGIFPATSSNPNQTRMQRVRVDVPESLGTSGGTRQNQNEESVGSSATNNSSSQSDSIQTAEDSMQTIRSIFSSLDANSSATTTADANGSSSAYPTVTASGISSEVPISMRSGSATSTSMSSEEENSGANSNPVLQVGRYFFGREGGSTLEPDGILQVTGVFRTNPSDGSSLPDPEDLSASARPQFIQVEEVENMELDSPLEDEFPEHTQPVIDYGRSRARKIFRPFRTSDDEMGGASTSRAARIGTASSLSSAEPDPIIFQEMYARESPSRSQQDNADGGNVADSTSTSSTSTARRQTPNDDDEIVFIPI